MMSTKGKRHEGAGGPRVAKLRGFELCTGLSSLPALQSSHAGKEDFPVHTSLSHAARCSTCQQDAIVCTPHCRASRLEHLTAYLGLLGLC